MPSDTYSLVRLGARERLVGRTRFCVAPADEVAGVEVVGGTKDADVERIVALAPDLVVANQEENTKRDIEALEARGLRVLVSFPQRVSAGVSHLARLARALGYDRGEEPARSVVAGAYHALREAEAAREGRAPVRAFVPIWMDPLMTVHASTFISDVLALAGAENVFADRERRYPLAADLGTGAPLPADRVADRDVRYPRVTLGEVVVRAPDLVLLPDEPHPFTEADAAVFSALEIPAAAALRRALLRREGPHVVRRAEPGGAGPAAGADRPGAVITRWNRDRQERTRAPTVREGTGKERGAGSACSRARLGSACSRARFHRRCARPDVVRVGVEPVAPEQRLHQRERLGAGRAQRVGGRGGEDDRQGAREDQAHGAVLERAREGQAADEAVAVEEGAQVEGLEVGRLDWRGEERTERVLVEERLRRAGDPARGLAGEVTLAPPRGILARAARGPPVERRDPGEHRRGRERGRLRERPRGVRGEAARRDGGAEREERGGGVGRGRPARRRGATRRRAPPAAPSRRA